jgi:hypothetical protein
MVSKAEALRAEPIALASAAAARLKAPLVVHQALFDTLGASGGLSATAESGAGKLPLAPVKYALADH